MAINRDINDQYLDAMGIQIYREKEAVQVYRDALVESSLETMDIQALSKTVEDCMQCELANITSQKTFATGSTAAKWFIISDKPVQKTTSGAPFFSVESSHLLEAILFSMNEKPQTIYTTAAVKCSQNKRMPTSAEYASCNAYLSRQIALVQPSVIVIFGEVAAQQLLAQNISIEQFRGKTHTGEIFNAPVVVTYHPEQLLNSPSLKRAVWEDIQLAKAQVLN